MEHSGSRSFDRRVAALQWKLRRFALAAVLVAIGSAGCGGGGGSSEAAQDPPPPAPPPPPPAGVLQLDAATYSAGESTQTVSFTVTRSGGSSGEVSVEVSTADGTAVAGSDYGTMTTTATFPDGDTAPKSGTVIIFDDNDHEADETLTLTLGSATGGATIGNQASAVVTIVDDDPVRVTIGGSIDDLAGSGLVLRNNGGDEVPVGSSEDSFLFPTPIAEGDTFDVTVAVQPWAPAQHCEVTNGSGIAGPADVTDVLVTCADVPLQSAVIHRTVGGQRDLVLVQEDGSGLVILANTVESETFMGFAGGRIIYAADGDVFSIAPDGSDRIALASDPATESFGGIDTDGGLVFFDRRAGVTAATDDVYVIGADGSGLTVLASTVDDEEYAGLAVDGSGKRAIYRRTIGGQDDLYSVKLDGTDTIAIAESPEFEEFGAITPGGRILFHRIDPDRDLYSVNADGTGLIALSTEPGDDHVLTMLEGERLLYQRDASTFQFDLFAVNADGSEHVALANTTVLEVFEGTTSGGRVVFRRHLSGHTDLYAVNADGTALATLAATPATEYFAGALPDGRLLYISADPTQPELADVFAVSADGTGTVQLTDTVEYEEFNQTAFLAGNRLVFSRDFNGQRDLFSMAMDGSDERRLTDTPDADERIFAITSSGGVVYHAFIDGQNDIYRIGADGNGFAVLAATVETESVSTIF